MLIYIIKLFGCVRETEGFNTILSNGPQCIDTRGDEDPKDGKVREI
jgi:hypothetical protein